MANEGEIHKELIALARAHLDELYDPRTHQIDVSPRLGNRDSYAYAMCLSYIVDEVENSYITQRWKEGVSACVERLRSCHVANFASLRLCGWLRLREWVEPDEQVAPYQVRQW